MSKQAIDRISANLAKTTDSKLNKDLGTSMRVQNQQGDFHILEVEREKMFETYRYYFPPRDDSPEAEREAVAAYRSAYADLILRYKRHSQGVIRRFKKKKSKGIALQGQELFLEAAIIRRKELAGQVAPNPVFIGGNYNTLQKQKGNAKRQFLASHPFFKAADARSDLKTKSGKKLSPLDVIAGKGGGGGQIEHGGAGGAAVAARARQFVANVEAEKKNLHPEDYHRLSLMGEYALKVTNSLERKMDVSLEGKLQLDHIQETVLTSGLANQAAKVDEEGVAKIIDLKDYNIAESEGSESLREAIEMVLLNGIAGKSVKGKRVTGKRAKRVRRNSKGKGQAKSSVKTPIAYLKDRGEHDSLKDQARVRNGKKSSSRSTVNLEILGILNDKLPTVVRNNMDPPALENQTGRLASSVKVTDIISTAKGFPSIGYTYDRDNYGQFEASSGSRFSSVERDPRRLIDRSIREIAAGAAMGRFFTRRV